MSETTDGLLTLDVRRHSLVSQIGKSLQRAGVSRDATIVAAVSGGRDSLALLLAMASLYRRGDLGGVVVGHVNHHRRGESDDEARHVQWVADQLDVPVAITHLPLDADGRPASMRQARYEALVSMATAWNAPFIATGHQAEDQLETILLAMVRGAGPSGLGGMRASRMLADGVCLVRPMLDSARQQAAALCGVAGIPWCDDPGNESGESLRGRLRLDVLPVLEDIRPGVALRAASAAELQQTAASALEAVTPKPIADGWPRGELFNVSLPLRRVALFAAAVDRCDTPDRLSSATLTLAAEAIGDDKQHCRTFEIGGGIIIVVDATTVRLEGFGDGN